MHFGMNYQTTMRLVCSSLIGCKAYSDDTKLNSNMKVIGLDLGRNEGRGYIVTAVRKNGWLRWLLTGKAVGKKALQFYSASGVYWYTYPDLELIPSHTQLSRSLSREFADLKSNIPFKYVSIDFTPLKPQ